MRKRVGLFVGLVGLLLLVGACFPMSIRGNGKVVTEERNVSGFDSITLSIAADVIITQDGDESVTVEAEENLMKYIDTTVRGRTLDLAFVPGPRPDIRVTEPIIFYVNVDELERIDVNSSGDVSVEAVKVEDFKVEVSGSGNVDIEKVSGDDMEFELNGSGDLTIDELDARELVISITGSGNIYLAGEAQSQDVRLSSSGQYQAKDLESREVEIEVTGSGDAEIWVTDSLEADLTGSGNVNYYGNPQVEADTTGSGEVVSRGTQQ
jgi:hypothetical protein